MDISDTILAGVAVLGVGAITALAYNKPNEYRRLFSIMVPVAFVFVVGVFIWDVALGYAERSVRRVPITASRDEIVNTIIAHAAITPNTLGLFVMVVAYLVLLRLIGWLAKCRTKE